MLLMVMLLAAISEALPPSQQVILPAMPAAMAIPMALPPSQQVMPLATVMAMAIPVALPPNPQVMPLATAMAILVALPPSQQVMPLPETETETEMQSIKVRALEEANRRRRWPKEILQLANQSITFSP